MKWDHLYQYYDGWSSGTLVKRLGSLEDYGPAEQIAEVADAVCDEKAASRLVQRAIDAGVVFSPANIMKLDGIIDEKTLTAAVKAALEHGASYDAAGIMELDGMVDPSVLTLAAKCSKATFTPEELSELDGIVDHDVLVAIDKRQGTQIFDYDDDEPVDALPEKRRPGGLFKVFAAFGMLAAGKQKKAPHFRVGDRVRVRYRGQEGTIVDINGSLYMVSLADGRHVDSYEESQLEKAW